MVFSLTGPAAISFEGVARRGSRSRCTSGTNLGSAAVARSCDSHKLMVIRRSLPASTTSVPSAPGC